MPRIANRIAVAALLAGALGGAAAAQPPSPYIPPGAQHPRFGGEFRLSPLGPISGYWPGQCRYARIQFQSRRGGPPPPPPVDAALHRFVSGLIAQQPNYADMAPPMAEAVRAALPTIWASLNRMGQPTVARRYGADPVGNDLYVLDQTGGETHWIMAVNADGRIEAAFLCRGQGV